MAELSVYGMVTRTELGQADLSLEDPGIYRIVSVGPGPLSWRRERITSPYIHGESLVGAVKETAAMSLSIRVLGTSAASLNTRTATLLRAFEQFNYQLTLVLDGVIWTWDCQPADYAGGDGGEFEPNLLRAFQQVYRFSIPRDPVPIAGSM